jgi:hypothetical protein
MTSTQARIVGYANCGDHIPLTCRHHPNKRWSTKNIAPLGCRSLFYNLWDDPNMGPECKCPIGDLVPLNEEAAATEEAARTQAST